MDEGEAKEERELEQQQPLFHPLQINSIEKSKKYYLSSNVGQYRRSQSVISSTSYRASKHLQAASCNSSSSRREATTIPGELSLWEEDKEDINVEQGPHSSCSPSLHMQELLSQLASSISTMSTAFTHVQASLNTYNIVGHESTSDAEKAIFTQEFQRLVDLEIGLHSLLQQYDMKEEHYRERSEGKCTTYCTVGAIMDDNIKNVLEKKDAMLKSYEGIITRFLDEIRRKEAVTQALKETLARSLLRGEKLEKRMKAVNVKTSPAPK